MTIVQKSGNINKNSDGLSSLELANNPDSQPYVPLEEEPHFPIEGIKITDIRIESIEEVRESYKQDKNGHILKSLLDKDCKDTALDSSLDEKLKTSYSEGRFHLFDSIIYHRAKNLV
ncbi:hypothetical protein O181_031293 [Austropuccinia psidii MF-1]|uniref:Uncharacterized protein n=1 Tax=Austropuccinia psidii MF-1 TaxID=1389203 RepID=A0A9Q3CZD5_9BASI|nr:hypothetical protein [Austropuccinia psidii MF-1]